MDGWMGSDSGIVNSSLSTIQIFTIYQKLSKLEAGMKV
jgi:hypothetical protein